MFRALSAVTLVIAMLLPSSASATAQIADRIQIDGVEYRLHTNPLAPYLHKRNWKPPQRAMVSTANWRGYVAHWDVADGRLRLKDVTIRVSGDTRGSDRAESILPQLFPSSGPVVADWYSGALVVPEGDITRYVHMGYASSYARYQVLRVASGRIVEHRRLSAEAFDQYRADKFEAFTRTDTYRTALKQLRSERDPMTDAQLQDFIRNFYAEQYLAL